MSELPARLLCRSWTRTPEDDDGPLTAFRPTEGDIPPARRPRTTIELAADGALRRFAGPAPDDRRTATSGAWALEGDELVLRPDGDREERYVVACVDDGRLVLRPTTP